MRTSGSSVSGSRVWLARNLLSVLPIVASAGAVLWIYDPRRQPALFLGFVFVWAAALALVLWRWRASSPPLAAVLIVAGLLRLLLLPLPLSLSDDAHRYVWDGQVVRAGHNPYLLAPEAPELAPLRDAGWERVAHRDVATVYPPLALAVFALTSAFAAPLLVLKLVLSSIDLVTCGLLVVYAARRGVPGSRVLAYAWNPLVVIETAGMGHVDALGLPWLVAAALAIEAAGRGGGRVSAAGAAKVAASLAAAVLAKLVPALAVPALARLSGRGAAVALATAAVVLALFASFLVDIGGPPPGLVTYGVSWEFNGPLFEPLWRLLAIGRVAEATKAVLAALERCCGVPIPDRAYSLVYPQLLAKVVLAVGVAVLVAWSVRSRDPAQACLRVFAGWSLLSPTVYPWYLLWMLPWAALLARPAWLLLSVTSLFAYLPTLVGVALLPWPFLLVWVPPLALAMVLRRTS